MLGQIFEVKVQKKSLNTKHTTYNNYLTLLMCHLFHMLQYNSYVEVNLALCSVYTGFMSTLNYAMEVQECMTT